MVLSEVYENESPRVLRQQRTPHACQSCAFAVRVRFAFSRPRETRAHTHTRGSTRAKYSVVAIVRDFIIIIYFIFIFLLFRLIIIKYYYTVIVCYVRVFTSDRVVEKKNKYQFFRPSVRSPN